MTLSHSVLPPALLGASPAAAQARALAARAGAAPLLIVAEDGLEPEVVARHLHDRHRPGKPFVSVDAGDAPGDVERRLLGARTPLRAADFEVLAPASALAAARGGTVFVKQLGDLPASAQRRLARVLRDGEAAVGARDRVRTVPVVIAAVAPDVDRAVRTGQLLADLAKRFRGEPLVLPPLRSRPGDFPEVLAAVARELAPGVRRSAVAFTQAAITVLAALPWSQNLHELRRTLERILRDAGDGPVKQEDVLAGLAGDGVAARIRPHVSLREARRRFEQDYIAAVLEEHDWRMSDAARTLGIERANLYRKARQLGITRRFPRKVADAS
jgi:DNA-binding NtrC family response regulator